METCGVTVQRSSTLWRVVFESSLMFQAGSTSAASASEDPSSAAICEVSRRFLGHLRISPGTPLTEFGRRVVSSRRTGSRNMQVPPTDAWRVHLAEELDGLARPRPLLLLPLH